MRALPLVLITLVAGCLANNPGGPDASLDAPTLVCPAPCAGDIRVGYASEPHLAFDAANPGHAALVFKGGGPGFAVLLTKDGGETWVESAIEPPADPTDGTWPSFGDPTAAYLDGAVVTAGIGHSQRAANQGVGRDIVAITEGPTFATIFDGGGVYANSPVSSDSVPVAWNNGDKPWIASGPDVLAAVWTAVRGSVTGIEGSSDNVLLFSSSSDGRAWTSPELVFDASSPRAGVLAFHQGEPLVVVGSFNDMVLRSLRPSEGAWHAEEVVKHRGQAVLLPSGNATWMIVP